MKSYHVNRMDAPRGYYAEWTMSNRERQIPYDFIYMWNVKNKMHEQTKQKQTHRGQTNCQMVGVWEAGWKKWRN